MPIKAIVAKLDDVDEKYRDLYTQQGDKWVITGIEGIKTTLDTDKLTKALTAERAAHGETNTKLKAATEKLTTFGDSTPEKIQELQEKIATFEAAGTPELQKNFEKIVAERVAAQIDTKVKAATAKLEKTIGELNTQLGSVTKENENFKQVDQIRTIDDAVRSAATKAKVQDAAVTDALMRAHSAFQIQEGKVLTKEGQTPEEWLEARKADAGHWWPVSRSAGAHGSDGSFTPNADNPWHPTAWNVTKQGQIVRADPSKAERLATSVGSRVGATAPPAKAA